MKIHTHTHTSTDSTLYSAVILIAWICMPTLSRHCLTSHRHLREVSQGFNIVLVSHTCRLDLHADLFAPMSHPTFVTCVTSHKDSTLYSSVTLIAWICMSTFSRQCLTPQRHVRANVLRAIVLVGHSSRVQTVETCESWKHVPRNTYSTIGHA